MAKQTINLGTAPAGAGGDTPRSAFTKMQANVDELYVALGGSTTLPAALPVAKGGTGATDSDGAAIALGFIKKGVQNTTTGTKIESGTPGNIAGISSSGNDYNTALLIGNGSNQYASSVISFIRAGAFGCHLGLDTDNTLRVGGWSYGPSSFKIYHEGNTTRAADGTLKAV
jgi:hypothetical protein